MITLLVVEYSTVGVEPELTTSAVTPTVAGLRTAAVRRRGVIPGAKEA